MFSGFLRTGGVLSDLTIHPIQVLGSKTKKLRIFEIFNRYIFCLKWTKNVLIYFVIQVTHSLSKRWNWNLFEFADQVAIFNTLSKFKQPNQLILFVLVGCYSKDYKLAFMGNVLYIRKPVILFALQIFWMVFI